MRKRQLTNAYLSMLCTEYAMLFQSGITAGDGTAMMLDDETDKERKAILQNLLATLEKGKNLSEALNDSGYFPDYMITMVGIGEKTGRLPETLTSLSEHYDRKDRLTAAVKNATLYPAILLAMMVAVVFVLIVQVLPIFNDTFARLGTQMSPMAMRLMQFGNLLKGVSAGIALVFGVLFAVALLLWIIPELREGISKAFKNRMGNKGVFNKIASTHFVSGITLAMASGLDLDKALEMAASISGDVKAVREQQEKSVKLINTGSSLSSALRDSGIISARDARVLAIGERSGMSDAVMGDIAKRSERETQEEINRIVARIEPTLVVITTAIIGVILLSVMLPMMGIMTAIG
ncbi:MAG: type II secretion system F family protein [Defluviitaleaceae bacterium]|nr:type II secretion system F family protein [Defluviitaleaceae bacterium]